MLKTILFEKRCIEIIDEKKGFKIHKNSKHQIIFLTRKKLTTETDTLNFL